MYLADHLDKYRRFDSACQRLDPRDDFVLWYWAVSSAGTCLINAALHRLGALKENRHFATQVPDVYAVADDDASWHYEIAHDCDLIHAGIPELAAVPNELVAAFAAMERIERYRNPCIRSEHPVTDAMLRDFVEAYAEVRKVTGAVLGEDLQ